MKVNRFLAILPAAVGVLALSAARAADLSIANTQAAGFDDTTPAQPVSVNIGTTRGQQALIVFQTAAAMWGASVRSAVPIVIDSQFNSAATDSVFTCSTNSTVLAYTSPSGYVTGSDFPLPNAGYDFALANALSGTDLSLGGAQFQVNINGDLGTSACAFPAAWYFGLDSSIPAGQVSLFTTLLHEFGHGLGYSSLVNPTNGVAESADLSIFDFHIFDVDGGIPWTSDSAAIRKALVTTPSALAFDGPAVRADIPTYLAPPPALFTHFQGVTTQLDFAKGEFSGPLVGSAPVVAAVPLDACSNLTNSAEISGKYALIERSFPDAGVVCTFLSKAERAQDAGAAGVIIFDHPPAEGLVTMSGTPALGTPAVFISNQDGLALQAEVGQGPVTATFAAGTQVSNTDPSGTRVLLYTPSSVSAGSSVIHWNSNSYPRTLNMEFAIQPDIRLDMDFTPDVMSDLGWSVVKGLTVSVVKLLEPLVVPGQQSSYVVAIINRRPTAINSVTLDLTAPASSTIASTVSSPAGCSTGLPCTFGPMQAGDVVLVVTTLQVAATASGSFPVNVTLTPSSASSADSLTAATTQTVATGGDLKVAVTGPASVIPGSPATLVTTVTNVGPGTATGVVLNGAVSGSASNPPTFSANSGGCTGAFPCSVGTLTSGASVSVNTVFSVAAGFASGASFTATVSSTTQDPNPANNSASYAFSTTGKSGCSATGEPASVLGLLGLGFGFLLRRRRV